MSLSSASSMESLLQIYANPPTEKNSSAKKRPRFKRRKRIAPLTLTHYFRRCLRSLCGTRRIFFVLSASFSILIFLTFAFFLQNFFTKYFRWVFGDDDEFEIFYQLLRENQNTKLCTLPQFSPWEASIQQYLKVPQPLMCKSLQPELTYLDSKTHALLFNTTEMLAAGIKNVTDILCEFRCFDKMPGDDFTVKYDDKWQTIKNGTITKCEFVETRCYNSHYALAPFYTNAHAQIFPNNKKSSSQINRKYRPSKHNMPSVVLFVVDSVSHSNWLRNLPLTLDVLKQTYNATIFRGFNKVADNSYPNAVAFLTGKQAYNDTNLKKNMFNDYFDDWPLIWKDFKAKGYSTYYSEDFVDFNLFSYLAKGFRKKPTDHYFRPFWLHATKSFLYRRSTQFCFGNKMNHRLQLEYLSSFIQSYTTQNSPFFALNWLSELSHDWMNQANMIAVADEDFVRFFKDAHASLRNAFVFVFADHGHRFDGIRQSLVGRIEERMPFFSIHVPDWLHKVVPDLHALLQKHSEQLMTFWDLHITLKDILYLTENDAWDELKIELNSENLNLDYTLDNVNTKINIADDRWQSKYQGQNDFLRQFRSWAPSEIRGISLLRRMPNERNCVDAGVPAEFCVCQSEREANVSDIRVQSVAHELVRHVNKLLGHNIGSDYDNKNKCAKLMLIKVLNAQVFLPNEALINSPRYSNIFHGGRSTDFFLHYRVAVEVAPSGAILEATLNQRLPDKQFRVVGDVNRINKYGNQSICVKSPILRKYCYCI